MTVSDLVFAIPLFFIQHARRVPLEDVIGRGRFAYVADAVRLIGRLKNHRTRPDGFELPVDQ